MCYIESIRYHKIIPYLTMKTTIGLGLTAISHESTDYPRIQYSRKHDYGYGNMSR